MSRPTTPGDCLGQKLLILGDVNSGKTTFTRRMLQDLCARGFGSRIAIVDLAPAIPPEIAAARGDRGAGGALAADAATGVLLVHPVLQAPRLTSSSESQARQKAADNKERIDAAWPDFLAAGRDILFLNDASLYLQAGSAGLLVARIQEMRTVVASGYFGARLGGGGTDAARASANAAAARVVRTPRPGAHAGRRGRAVTRAPRRAAGHRSPNAAHGRSLT